MTQESQIAAFRLSRLAQWQRHEIPLWNWYCAAFPRAAEWKTWLGDVAAQLLRRPGQARASLVKTSLVEPAAQAERFAFARELLTIGRDPTNEIVLPEATITRQHARLRADGRVFFLEDLGSAMGTIAAGNKLTPGVPLELTGGDSFVIFPHRFQLEVERAWLPAEEVTIWEPVAETGEWSCFRRECPAGWTLLAVLIEPLAARVYLAIEAALLRALVERALPSPSLWGVVDEAVTEVLLLTVLERANRDLAMPFRFALGNMRRPSELADSARGIALRTTLSVEGMRGAIRLFLPFELLAGMQQVWTGRPAATLHQQATWRWGVSAGWIDLTADEQASIEPGDIVLHSSAPALLFPGDDRLGWHATWDTPHRLRIVAQRKSEMPDPAEIPVSFQDLPVRVQVVVDEHEITLAEAQALAPGAVLDLDRDAGEPVRLAVNGRLVGTGELVEIEGRMGVRILSWSRA